MKAVELTERDQGIVRLGDAWAFVHRAEQIAQFTLAPGGDRGHDEEVSLRRHRLTVVGSGLPRLEELDQGALVGVVEVGAVKMPAIAVPPNAGVEAEAICLRVAAAR